MLNLDKLIIEFDKGLRTLFAEGADRTPLPGYGGGGCRDE